MFSALINIYIAVVSFLLCDRCWLARCMSLILVHSNKGFSDNTSQHWHRRPFEYPLWKHFVISRVLNELLELLICERRKSFLLTGVCEKEEETEKEWVEGGRENFHCG